MSDFNDNKSMNKRIVALLFSKYLKTFILVFLLILFVLSFLFVVKPRYTKMKNASNVLLDQKKQELESLELYLSKLISFNRSYKNITSSSSNMESLNKLMPNENDFEDLVVLVDGMVRNRKLSLISVDIEGASASAPNTRIRTAPTANNAPSTFPEKVKKVTLKLSIEGADYKTMKNLVSDFETSSRLFDVSEISFNEGSNSMSMTIIAYYFEP